MKSQFHHKRQLKIQIWTNPLFLDPGEAKEEIQRLVEKKVKMPHLVMRRRSLKLGEPRRLGIDSRDDSESDDSEELPEETSSDVAELEAVDELELDDDDELDSFLFRFSFFPSLDGFSFGFSFDLLGGGGGGGVSSLRRFSLRSF